MKKILLALIIAFSFSSAIAAEESVGFNIDKKPPTTLKFLLGSNNAGDSQTQSNYQCEQNCWNNRRICINSGQNFTVCTQALLQCIDTCEGAGGLYQ